MSDLSWQSIVALACVTLAALTLLWRAWRFFRPNSERHDGGGCGSCGGCATDIRAKAAADPPPFIPLETLQPRIRTPGDRD